MPVSARLLVSIRPVWLIYYQHLAAEIKSLTRNRLQITTRKQSVKQNCDFFFLCYFQFDLLLLFVSCCYYYSRRAQRSDSSSQPNRMEASELSQTLHSFDLKMLITNSEGPFNYFSSWGNPRRDQSEKFLLSHSLSLSFSFSLSLCLSLCLSLSLSGPSKWTRDKPLHR